MRISTIFYWAYWLLAFALLAAVEDLRGDDSHSHQHHVDQSVDSRCAANLNNCVVNSHTPSTQAGALANYTWEEIPGTSENTVFTADVDDQFENGTNAWKHRRAWSAGVFLPTRGKSGWYCTFGGGHGYSAHNGVNCFDFDALKWLRLVEPCPNLPEPRPYQAATIPCGNPVAKHSYYHLAELGGNIIMFGGSNWSVGNAGDPPRSWLLDVDAAMSGAKNPWRKLPAGDAPAFKATGASLPIADKIYYPTDRAQVYDTRGKPSLDDDAWFTPNNVAYGGAGQVTLEYSPMLDLICRSGRGAHACISPEDFAAGMSWTATSVPPPDSLAARRVSAKYGSAFWFPSDEVFVLWGQGSGNVFVTFDPISQQWNQLTMPGEPLPRPNSTGTFRSIFFNQVDGAIYYIGSREQNVYRATLNARPATVATLGTNPYLPSARGPDYPEQVCGPKSTADHIVVASVDDAIGVRYKTSERMFIDLRYSNGLDYPVIKLKRARCVWLVAERGPNGERPRVGGINMTQGYKPSSGHNIYDGGLYIEGVEGNPGEVFVDNPTLSVSNGDCIGTPNRSRFLYIVDSVFKNCGHHVFITSHAHHLVVYAEGNHFQKASSHLLYIDHVARADIINNKIESPGWGHALRVIAREGRVSGNEICNIQCDGTILPVGSNPLKPKRTYIGMTPLEVYTGGETLVENNRIVYHRASRNTGTFAAIFRWREAMNTIDQGEPVGDEWSRLRWGDPDYNKPSRWSTVTPLTTISRNNLVQCLGLPCNFWEIKSSYPVMNDAQKYSLQAFLKSNAFVDWPDLLTKIAAADPDGSWQWVANQTLARHRAAFMAGRITNKVPLPVPLDAWFQRSYFETIGDVVNNGRLLAPLRPTKTYCYGAPIDAHGKCEDEFEGKSYRRAIVTVK